MLSSVTNRTAATGSDSTAVYNYGFRIFAEADLLVTVRNLATGVETTLVLTTDYTVSGVGQASGSITLVNAAQAWLDGSGDLAATYKIVIRRVRTLQQNTSIRNQGTYYASVHEDTFDDLAMKIQQLDDSRKRALSLPETFLSSDFNPVLPGSEFVAPVAGALMIVNPTSDGLKFGPSVTAVEAAIEAANAVAVAAGLLNDWLVGHKFSIVEGQAATSLTGEVFSEITIAAVEYSGFIKRGTGADEVSSFVKFGLYWDRFNSIWDILMGETDEDLGAPNGVTFSVTAGGQLKVAVASDGSGDGVVYLKRITYALA